VLSSQLISRSFFVSKKRRDKLAIGILIKICNWDSKLSFEVEIKIVVVVVVGGVKL
jgi:hypothetical protein